MKSLLFLCFLGVGVQNSVAVSPFEAVVEEWEVREALKKRVKLVTSSLMVGWVWPQKHISKWKEIVT